MMTGASLGKAVTVPAGKPSPMERVGSGTEVVTGLPNSSVVVYTMSVRVVGVVSGGGTGGKTGRSVVVAVVG